LNLTQLTDATGLIDTVLPVNYKVSFVGTNPTDPLVNDIRGLQEILQSRGNSFQITPEPGLAATFLLGGLALLLWSRRRSRSRK